MDDRSLSAWRLVRTDRLPVNDETTPRSTVFSNATCALEGAAPGVAHGGSVKLPGGKAIPPPVTSCAAPDAAEHARILGDGIAVKSGKPAA
jgi:hypothetical protein